MTVDEKNIFNSISGDQNREKKLEFLLNLYNKNTFYKINSAYTD